MRPWSLTKTIIAINCIIAIVSLLLGPEDPANWIKNQLPFYIPDFYQGQVWRLFTYSWVHADLIGLGTLHLAFNMMSLVMLGHVIEYHLGIRHFCCIYIPAGLLAAFFHLIESFIRNNFLQQTDFLQISLVGASGSVLGLAAAFGLLYPEHRIILFPWPFPVRASRALFFFALISVLFLFLPYLNFIAHSAHLGGMFWGYLYLRLLKRNEPHPS
jgi:membrane associated rhomboid family serine protease